MLIDGVAHPMIRGAKISQGTVYQYSTTLGRGTHHYSFVVTNSQGTTVLPFNNTTYAGPVVGDVSLDSLKVSRSVSTPGQPITFSVRYTSTTNTAPTQAQLQLDGISYTMTPSAPLDYASGVTYTYVTSSLGIGDHFFRFVFNEGTGPWILEGLDQPSICRSRSRARTCHPRPAQPPRRLPLPRRTPRLTVLTPPGAKRCTSTTSLIR